MDARFGNGLCLGGIRNRRKQDDPCIAQRLNPLQRREAEVEADDLGLLLKEGSEHVVICQREPALVGRGFA